MQDPTICVLLATYNGRAWLGEQLDSLAGQAGVQVAVVASDDTSTDTTRDILLVPRPGLQLSLLPTASNRLGSANRNFLRLIRDALVGTSDFIALADQDDVWLPTKLQRAVSELRRSGAQAYSGNVTAFWPDGSERLLVKSRPQRRFDHLFESAGPGCTFVFTRTAYQQLRLWVTQNFDALQDVRVHDWLIYAYGRQAGWSWHIDAQSHMRYRQHALNEMGANRGLAAALSRWGQVRSGRYREDVVKIADAVGDQSVVHSALRRLSLMDRLRLVLLARECRRTASEAMLLALFFLVFPKPAQDPVDR
jgi:rhamnosyltransferase